MGEGASEPAHHRYTVGIEGFIDKNDGDTALLEGLRRVAAPPSVFRQGA